MRPAARATAPRSAACTPPSRPCWPGSGSRRAGSPSSTWISGPSARSSTATWSGLRTSTVSSIGGAWSRRSSRCRTARTFASPMWPRMASRGRKSSIWSSSPWASCRQPVLKRWHNWASTSMSTVSAAPMSSRRLRPLALGSSWLAPSASPKTSPRRWPRRPGRRRPWPSFWQGLGGDPPRQPGKPLQRGTCPRRNPGWASSPAAATGSRRWWIWPGCWTVPEG